MNLLILGSTGQVGWELQRALAPLGEVTALDRTAGNLEDLAGLGRALDQHRPNVIVNAAAHTAVDQAESDAARAALINTAAVKVLAQGAAKTDALLVHYSTDYVFDGNKAGRYLEDDPTNPQGVYGVTKRDGEEAIRASGCRHLIFRTSWVHAARGKNFVRTMLRLAAEHSELKVVADQVGAPTSAELIADVSAHAIRSVSDGKPDLLGTYHLASTGETSWHGFAQVVLEEGRRCGLTLKVGPEAILPITTAEYPTPAKRPANSRLDTTLLRRRFGLTLPLWQVGVRRSVAELGLR